MRVGVGAEPVVAAGGRRVGWFAPFRLVFRFWGLARLAGWGGRWRLVVPFFSGQQQRAQRGGGHVQRVQQALGVAVGFAFVAAAVKVAASSVVAEAVTVGKSPSAKPRPRPITLCSSTERVPWLC